ncbi:fatty-acyl-CoA synthase [Sphingomonas kaistensis]|uniref:Fatty-acyl-CoA synthase n=1 Tax=Sphingomonas kaistensis TaxID=298708 RepID=A0A7X5Y6Y4_9SPHN|nr:AMP-binding protein [Sphingomonas kaistensis]NJC04646.1 fatty-acyl-CoA synthase [Sphingomonas kaistensis]
MQDYPLTVDRFLTHAAKWFGTRHIVSARPDGAAERTTYAEVQKHANRLSGALAGLGVGEGSRVASLAWNSRHHFELYFAVMGMGAVCHTLNPRLTAAQLAAMVTEADDRVLAVAADLLPLGEELMALCAGLRHLIILDKSGAGSLDELLEQSGSPYAWGRFDEQTMAGLCYTSGTTGAPKGVPYTHRSNYLHTLRALGADVVGLTASDTLLLAVPMFHANGWGLPFAAPAVGAKLVLPGRQLDGASLARLMSEEEVTVAVGVQTVWLGLLDHLERSGTSLPKLERVLIGGSNCPEALLRRLEQGLGARVQTSWGMTELSPIGTMSPPGEAATAGTSGRPAIGLDLKLTDEHGATLADQRGQQGHLKVRGASVLDRYLGADSDALDDEGYFDTGDLALIDESGNLIICGRSKDLIKSGGEWINPAEIEAIVGDHPSIRHVAVIGRSDPRWGERPLMVVERSAGGEVAELLALLKGRVADWWIPDRVIEVAAMPLATTGKIDKQRLRADYASAA